MTPLIFVNTVLGLGIILGQLFLAITIIWFLFFRKKETAITNYITNHGILLAFLVALASSAGSLFYSQIAGFKPCDLCWYQRIFMYPEVLLLGLALIKKETRILDYALSLSVVGAAISLYHNYVYLGFGTSSCQISASGAVSCATKYVVTFGYVTIPMMALTAFLLIITFLVFKKIYPVK